MIAGSAISVAILVGAVSPVTTTAATQEKVTNTSGIYAALGDSIAAGAGLSPSANSGGSCARSSESYPHKVAQAKGLTLVHLACSGATVSDAASQLDQAFANGTPQVITITAGANDMQWMQFIRKCAVSECGTSADIAATQALRTVMEQKLSLLFAEINTRSNGNPPRVVITGYTNPVSNYCKGRQDLVVNNEINWLNKERDQLNKSIRKSMKGYKFVRYASMNFTNHTVCARVPWSQGLDEPAPLHPNALGHSTLAKTVSKYVR